MFDLVIKGKMEDNLSKIDGFTYRTFAIPPFTEMVIIDVQQS